MRIKGAQLSHTGQGDDLRATGIGRQGTGQGFPPLFETMQPQGSQTYPMRLEKAYQCVFPCVDQGVGVRKRFHKMPRGRRSPVAEKGQRRRIVLTEHIGHQLRKSSRSQ